MAIQFDPTKLAMFKEFNTGNENTIANLDGTGKIKANGTYGGAMSVFSRTDADRVRNNAARTALLKALGQAFGLSGMSEVNGVATFSKDFMDKLQEILGRDVFKRDDFKVGADGIVKSGRPLTERRITAILSKAAVVGNAGFDVDVYMKKLDFIKKELGLGAMPKGDLNSKAGKDLFFLVEKGLNFLKNDIFTAKKIVDPETGKTKTVYGPKKAIVDKSFIRINPDYLDYKEFGMDTKGLDVLQIRGEDGRYVKFDKPKRDELLRKLMANEVFHLERADFDEKNPASMEALKNYIAGCVQLFVQKMVDLYFESKEASKLELFMEHLENKPGACIEDKGYNLNGFEEKHLSKGKPVDKAEAAKLERIANESLNQELSAQIYNVIDELQKTDPKYRESEDWADFADAVKERLVGKTGRMMTAVKNEKRNQYDFEPKRDRAGDIVYRKIDADDIDEIGPACLYNVLGY